MDRFEAFFFGELLRWAFLTGDFLFDAFFFDAFFFVAICNSPVSRLRDRLKLGAAILLCARNESLIYEMWADDSSSQCCSSPATRGLRRTQRCRARLAHPEYSKIYRIPRRFIEGYAPTAQRPNYGDRNAQGGVCTRLGLIESVRF
jgi:hypothetical protein